MSNKNKLLQDLKIREAHRDSWPIRGLNEDYSIYVKTTAWNLVFRRMDQNGHDTRE